MAGTLKVLDGGATTTLQDAGRHGYRSLGVALSGALDPLWLACANALVGNPADTVALEMRVLGPRLEIAQGSLCLALAGDAEVQLIRSNQNSSALPAWRSITLEAGDVLHIGAIRSGVAYLAVAGGIDVPEQLGSRSTYARAKIGGIDGRALRSGDILPGGDHAVVTTLAHPLTHAHGYAHATGPIRVLPGPQDDCFTEEALAIFFSTAYTVTHDLDRMGIRLSGARLTHHPAKGADIVSDGVTPGAIQAPADGQPILLLADCQTVGGYPKIATVISADLPRLAHLLPGMQVNFATVTRAQAHAALRAQAAALQEWIAGLAPHRPAGWVNEAALYGDNLISGMVDAGVNET
ncbi:MAG: biotin-dependent carboxyltransferase family protein [Betaproteobacteria bacterium]|nr:biotin-dependent carboxyltransferase family protein [Betaproteobacteria bacterium]